MSGAAVIPVPVIEGEGRVRPLCVCHPQNVCLRVPPPKTPVATPCPTPEPLMVHVVMHIHRLMVGGWWRLWSVGEPLDGRGYVAILPTCGPLLILSPALESWGPWLVAVGGGWQLAVGGWRLAVGSWWQLVVGGWWLTVAGGWRLVVPRGCPGGWGGGVWHKALVSDCLVGGNWPKSQQYPEAQCA